MYSLEEFIIAVYCEVDDALKVLTLEQRIRSRGFAPGLSDSEVIAMEIIAEYQGIDADKAIWQYFHRHWKEWFPQLSSRSNFVRQSANLCQVKQLIQQGLATRLGAFADCISLMDCLCPYVVLPTHPAVRVFKALLVMDIVRLRMNRSTVFVGI